MNNLKNNHDQIRRRHEWDNRGPEKKLAVNMKRVRQEFHQDKEAVGTEESILITQETPRQVLTNITRV